MAKIGFNSSNSLQGRRFHTKTARIACTNTLNFDIIRTDIQTLNYRTYALEVESLRNQRHSEKAAKFYKWHQAQRLGTDNQKVINTPDDHRQNGF